MVKQTLVAATLASLIPPIPFLFISLVAGYESLALAFAFAAWLVTVAHVFLLGLPAFLLLLRMRWASRWTLLAAGFVLGFSPTLIAGWSSSHALWPAVSFGLIGAFTALAFWLLWRGLGPNNSFKGKPLRGSP